MRTNAPTLDPREILVLPQHKRAVAQYGVDAEGRDALTVFYGAHEITFDDPATFAFAEGLIGQESFAAGDAVNWGPAYDWPTVAALLTELIDEGVLHREAARATARGPAPTRLMPSPLPQASAGPARTWVDCRSVSKALCGRALDLGHLEMVVPVFRIAHPALDADGRQVGEANVFPPPLRIETPTEWRACPHAGTRFQAPQPMNITAMRAMRAHWGQMMQALAMLRAAYLRRFPLGPEGWTVADVERAATLVLAVPTYVLMRRDEPVRSGELHPALSSLFRVTDGLRITAHQMLFVPGAEPNLAPDAPVTSAKIHAYAERNYNFHSPHGVCAGPKAMIEDFLAVILDGAAPKDSAPVVFDPQVSDALAQAEAAFDYGLLGLQAHFTAFSHWPLMARAIERMAAAAGGRSGPSWDRLRAMADQVRANGYHANEALRVARERSYADLARACNRGLAPHLRTHVPDAWADDALRGDFAAMSSALRGHLTARLGDRRQAWSLQAALEDFALGAHAQLRTATDIQAKLNACLGRPRPLRPFRAQDMQIHLLIQGRDEAPMPHLIDELDELLGLDLTISRDGIGLNADTEIGTRRPAPVPTKFAGIPPANERAPKAQIWREP